MTESTQKPKGKKTVRTGDMDCELSLTDFIVFTNSRRARHGFERKLTEEEYTELYERYSRLPPERRRSILLEEAPTTEYTNKPEVGELPRSGEERRPTREELIAELMKRPPKRRLELMRVLEIVVAKKRLDKAIKDGTARPN